MDYDAEQRDELEALEAILGEDAVQDYTGMVPEGWTDGKIHKVNVQPDTDDLETDLCFDLLFQHTDTYPETAPNLKVSNPRGLSNANVEALTRALVACAEENVGMASVFTVMQAGKDWLESKAGIEEAVDPALLKKQEEEAAEAARAAHRAQGTPVTTETFAAWRAKFEAEMRAKGDTVVQGDGKNDGKSDGGAPRERKVTGKEWFLERDKGDDAGDVEALEEELAELDVDDESDAESGSGQEGGYGVGQEVLDGDESDDDEDFLDELEGELEAQGANA